MRTRELCLLIAFLGLLIYSIGVTLLCKKWQNRAFETLEYYHELCIETDNMPKYIE